MLIVINWLSIRCRPYVAGFGEGFSVGTSRDADGAGTRYAKATARDVLLQSLPVDRGLADGSVYRALKERTKRLKDGDELETA